LVLASMKIRLLRIAGLIFALGAIGCGVAALFGAVSPAVPVVLALLAGAAGMTARKSADRTGQ
jgi:hypothetical protein